MGKDMCILFIGPLLNMKHACSHPFLDFYYLHTQNESSCVPARVNAP